MADETHRIDPDLLHDLMGLGDLRVWSVIITIFGDSALPRGGTVPASVLTAICAHLGIRPEALRVALYRLAKDGWILRQRSGRNAYYALSAKGLEEFAPASRRIYATDANRRGPWRMVACDPAAVGQDSWAQGLLRIGEALYLADASVERLPPESLVMRGTLSAIPDWVRYILGPADLSHEFNRLEDALRSLRVALDNPAVVRGSAAVAVRTLVVHRWRRLVLRTADVPAEMLPQEWRGEACRGLFLDIHRALSATADPWLDEAIGNMPASV